MTAEHVLIKSAPTQELPASNRFAESDKAFRLLADAMPQIVWCINSTGTSMLYLNQRWYAYTGLTIEQSLQEGPNQVIHSDDRGQAELLWAESLVNGTPYETELRLRAVDGSYRWFLVRCVPVRNPDGEILQWFGTSTDIDDRKRTEESLRRVMQRFALAEEAALGFVYEWDVVTDRVERSAGITALLGYGPEDLDGHRLDWFSLVHPEDQSRLQNALANEVQGVERYSYEYRVRHKNGHYCYVWDRAVLTRNEQGQVVRVIGSTVDITERKRAATSSALYAEVSDALANSLDPHETINRVLPLLVPKIADYGVVQLLEDSGKIAVVATAHRDPVGKEALDTLVSSYQPHLYSDSIASKVINRGEPLLITQVSETFYTSLPYDPSIIQLVRQINPQSFIAVPLLSRQGVIGVLTLGLVDEHHRYTNNDLVMVQELARRCVLALENARLYADAQRAIRQRDAFLSVAAHELRTPLTSMLGQAQLAQRRLSQAGVLSDRDRRSFEVIITQVGRLNRLITDLLDVSRLEQGQLQMARDLLDFNQLVDQVVEDIRPTLQSHTLGYQGLSEPQLILGDAGRLEQVLQNLLHNAVKYSPQGGEVQVTLFREEDRAVLEVRDQGIGIPAEALKNLFKRFFRAENATRLRITGVGVGLYVVHEIVSMHDGMITVHSVENEGTTFRISLPLASG
jgi:PAS domain S-box-containing protein